ncbi:predicted protein [Naegleria gruberi]|uniref:Predicted protein n=1 Tax=Naegleria gruberi TaxID=5762 RepID=D2UYF0_NAEGR|nr:uncharacterized protein NAEGRDRAFT_61448 [Naegleria gruberi]EFC50781.1 predicted protein [Naegleria gruberi]|eukprot:XP_002683525.1 predicted protein [Naegleria gruberi strain NEG-M]
MLNPHTSSTLLSSSGAASLRGANQKSSLMLSKGAIDKHLDDRKGLYWNTFIKYLQAKLSKTEWDHFIKITFGYEFIALHNYFIKSLLCNAKISTFHHLNGTSSTDGAKRKNRGINNMMMLMEKELLHLSSQNLIFDNLCLHTSTSYNPSKSVNLSNEKHYTKDLFESKMNKIANDLGVMNVDGESINLLYYATEYYLKNLITKCLQQKKQKYENYKKPQIGSYLVKDGKYTHSYRHYELPLPEEEEEEEFSTNAIHEIDKHVITPRDFSLTIQASPNLIDDIKLREKAINMDWDLYY